MITLSAEAQTTIESMAEDCRLDMFEQSNLRFVVEKFRDEFATCSSLDFWALRRSLNKVQMNESARDTAHKALTEASAVISRALGEYVDLYTRHVAASPQLIWRFRLTEAAVTKRTDKRYENVTAAELNMAHTDKAASLAFHRLDEFSKQFQEYGLAMNNFAHIGVLSSIAYFYREAASQFDPHRINTNYTKSSKPSDSLRTFYAHAFEHAPTRPGDAQHDWKFAQLKIF